MYKFIKGKYQWSRSHRFFTLVNTSYYYDINIKASNILTEIDIFSSL